MKQLSKGKKIGLGILGLFMVLGVMSPSSQQSNNLANQTGEANSQADEIRLVEAQPKDTIEVKEETKTEPIPFESIEQSDPNLSAGNTRTVVSGKNGERTITYEVTYTNGKETDRSVVSRTVTKEPVNEVIKVGTRRARAAPRAQPGAGCHSSYTGACVPITSDVDCAGGSGNGPAYVGRVNVVGPDVYDLDRDGNGVGCE